LSVICFRIEFDQTCCIRNRPLLDVLYDDFAKCLFCFLCVASHSPRDEWKDRISKLCNRCSIRGALWALSNDILPQARCLRDDLMDGLTGGHSNSRSQFFFFPLLFVLPDCRLDPVTRANVICHGSMVDKMPYSPVMTRNSNPITDFLLGRFC